MKKTTILFLAITVRISLLAQNATTTAPKLDATQVVEQLLNTKVFIDYGNSKKAIEGQLLALNNLSSISPEDYNALQGAYGQTKASFDQFLNLVRQDMLDYQLFERAANGDQATITRYLSAYNAGVAVYNQQFQPVYDRVVKTRSLKNWLEPLALQAFNFLGPLFKGKNARQNLLLNELLLASKKHFLGRMEMKPWEALVRIQPSGGGVTGNSTNNNPVPTTPPANASTSMPPTTLGASDSLVEAPVMKTLSGSLEILIAGNPVRSMNFGAPSRSLKRNLVIGEATPNANVGVASTIPVLTSTESYGEGTAFQIRVQNTALLYAFVLNSDGSLAPIYPFTEAFTRSFQMSKSRNLEVGPLMLQDAAGHTTIPAKNANTGAENYLKITGTAEKEQLCLVLSKSEIDLNDALIRLQQLPGSLAERVAALWQLEPHCASLGEAGLNMNGGKIGFNVSSTEKWLLPLVFEIQR
ncbi:MAG: hypothetical protein KIPDCIKN_03548 [Haliscomenobacter sp.]|jgi:hypothetical protein|nr:hypothetical protein [Haliscomenobacter sp.]